jgi:CopA family copper-resistance protein
MYRSRSGPGSGVVQDFNRSRRHFVQGLAGGAAILAGVHPARWCAAAARPDSPLQGTDFHLEIDSREVNFTGAMRRGTVVNGQLPGPLLVWRQGETVTVRVSNRLPAPTSIHWHGMIVPADMDGVPGLSFNGVPAGGTFVYRFQVNQSGTYWYHSHSRFQEQVGLYGPIVIQPRGGERHHADREHVILLSDWTDADPEGIYRKLKVQSDYFNYGMRTAADFFADARKQGLAATIAERRMWGQMRMSDTDLLDVSGHAYTYLMNGTTPRGNWTGLFRRGERLRLRIINGSSMSIFDLRIPGLKLTVVAADGQDVEPVTVDEFRIAAAEVYDVIVEPKDDRAYTIFAQSLDRSGYARGTLAPATGMEAEIPPLDPRPVLTMMDMGMAGSAGGMDMGGMARAPAEHDMAAMEPTAQAPAGYDAAGMDMGARGPAAQAPAGHDAADMDMSHMDMSRTRSASPAGFGPNVDSVATNPTARLDDPGVGLRGNGRRVLTYADLHTLDGSIDTREPGREIRLHLTGHMQRFVWSFDGRKFSESVPLRFNYGERLRIVLVNDSMMTHPIHLHGMWSEVESANGEFLVRKHTVLVQPGQLLSYGVSANALGRWAFHCHLLYHMEAGMFREVAVEGSSAKGASS